MLLILDDTPAPTFDAPFLSGVLPSGLTYTNSSTTRTYFGSDGLLKTAVANEPIFETLGGVLQGMRWEMEQRTNLALRSGDFTVAPWTGQRVTMSANQTTAPDGTISADKLIETVDSGIHFIGQDTTYTAAAHTVSVFAKAAEKSFLQIAWATGVSTAYANFNLTTGAVGTSSGVASSSIQSCGDGWYRCTTTLTPSAATGATIFSSPPSASSARLPVYAGDGTSGIFLWGAQVELGASASSYIPTAGAAVTRQPDVLAPASISPWFNSAEGTILFECIPSSPATTQRGMYLFSDGTDDERMGGYRASGLTGGYLVVDGGVTQADVSTLSSMAQSAVSRHAFAYKVNDFAGSVNGGAPVADAAGTIPTVTGLKLGQGNTAGTQAFMGYARRFQYFNTRLPNPQIQGMSRV